MKGNLVKPTLFALIIFGVLLGCYVAPKIGLLFTFLSPLISVAILWIRVIQSSMHPEDTTRRVRMVIEVVVVGVMIIGFWIGGFGRLLADWIYNLLY